MNEAGRATVPLNQAVMYLLFCTFPPSLPACLPLPFPRCKSRRLAIKALLFSCNSRTASYGALLVVGESKCRSEASVPCTFPPKLWRMVHPSAPSPMRQNYPLTVRSPNKTLKNLELTLPPLSRIRRTSHAIQCFFGC
jgi:hypothetical protein